MPVNHESKTLFVHIPKCGGTSVEKILDMSVPKRLYTYNKYNNNFLNKLNFSNFSTDDAAACKSKNMQHYTLIELKKLLPANVFSEYFKFSIVRNPYTRIVSEYFYCKDDRKNITFATPSEFILTELNLPRLERIGKYDGHLEIQSEFLLDENGTLNGLDKIYKFETEMDDVIGMAKQRAGIDITNIKAREGNYDKNVDYLSQEAKDAIYQFYKNDFDLFGYSKI